MSEESSPPLTVTTFFSTGLRMEKRLILLGFVLGSLFWLLLFLLFLVGFFGPAQPSRVCVCVRARVQSISLSLCCI